MCTYCNTNNYRAIYENHIGSIPRESDGRTYQIHHIDGNHQNNHPDNLKAVTIQEHYDIHYALGDWAACILLGEKIKLSPKEISNLASTHQRKRVEDGTHNFLGKANPNDKRIEEGTHNLLGKNNPCYKRIKNGTHNLLGDEMNRKRIEAGTHNFLEPEFQRNIQLTRIKAGTHNFLGENHPAKIKGSCIWCRKETNLPALTRLHSKDKCTPS